MLVLLFQVERYQPIIAEVEKSRRETFETLKTLLEKMAEGSVKPHVPDQMAISGGGGGTNRGAAPRSSSVAKPGAFGFGGGRRRRRK